MSSDQRVGADVVRWTTPGDVHGEAHTGARARRARGALIVGGLVVLYAVLVPVVASATGWWGGAGGRAVDYVTGSTAPSTAHPFGTDVAGRDMFVRCARALQVSLLAALVGSAASAFVGTLLGATSAVLGGRADRLLMRGVDAFAAVPHLLLGILVATVYRGSLWTVVLVVAVTHWTATTRLVRGEVLSLRERGWVRAAVSQGGSRARVLRHHVLPHVGAQVAVATALLVPHAVWHETTLTFLGLGLPPHQASLGSLIDLAQQSVTTGAWWTLVAPVGLLVVATVCLGLAMQRGTGRAG
ncbi:ABC transporter permease [Cellulomonas xiejunii]|uniref:ABC transporter permease n=1 Tax=Cellulomonas xiejunii TaxID=2968083 RepID=A0ABY5KSN6_9CELL|nr:ABC transporter permease [Cellulomonas xiejunii]MCC2314742.1 ABC transporter permease [Cellulomonas xiejunii]MCC2323004.1 ABC transporter permease [Cellulomonas xiejunii]UUI73501.1 ABC transporter permease [Cellulomonas xiejunii]